MASRSSRSHFPKPSIALLNARNEAVGVFREFLVASSKECPVIKTWFQHFDRSRSGSINQNEFRKGMKLLHYPANVDNLWSAIDYQDDNELYFIELHQEEASLWIEFRNWCGSTFQNPHDMIKRVKQSKASWNFGAAPTSGGSANVMTEEEVVMGLAHCGWEAGQEAALFKIMDMEDSGNIGRHDLKWLDVEICRRRQKEVARKKAGKIAEQKTRGRLRSQMALLDFKAFLRTQCGSLFRAWRRGLDMDGSMTLQRAECFVACRQLHWRGDVRALWKALDKDGSGSTTFEELDPHCAEMIARFKEWAVNIWGPKPAALMFQTMDKQRRQKLGYAHFAKECQARGFQGSLQTIAMCLDWRGKKYIQEDDLSILDTWRPPAWLVATMSLDAAEDFKKHLLAKYGHYVKAWRHALDRDGTNSCSFHEFTEAAKLVKFTGDVAGAWRQFDDNLSGSISLAEVDPEANDALMVFKKWADAEFGGVRPAFKILDADGSNHLNFKEFRSACTNFGFAGDARVLFESLDVQCEGTLQFGELAFLDDWEEQLTNTDLPEAADLEIHTGNSVASRKRSVTPGPGAYNVRSGFGARASMPYAKHSGSFTMGQKLFDAWTMPSIGPDQYESGPAAFSKSSVEQVCLGPSLIAVVKNKKPTWSFSGSPSTRCPEGLTIVPQSALGRPHSSLSTGDSRYPDRYTDRFS